MTPSTSSRARAAIPAPRRLRRPLGAAALVLLAAAPLASPGPAVAVPVATLAGEQRPARSGSSGRAATPPATQAPLRGTVGRPDETWQLPSTGELGALFVAPAAPWGAGHRGIDLVAGVGAPVRAPRAGVVVVAATVVNRGVVTLLHPDGLRTSLEPVAPDVAVGEPVDAGEVLGTVQPDGAHCAGCLHWGVRVGDRYLDPLSLLDRAPVVLLPSVSPVPPPGGRCAAGASPPCASGRSATR